jgi:cytochrome c553
MSFRLSAFILILLAVCNGPALLAAGKLQFNRDVRPILSDKCFHCHGPDSKKREGDLRLDERAAAVKEGHITPGKPEKSLIIGRILSHDPDDMMPPPKSKLGSLSPVEIETLTQWIQEGAEYEAHWSFISLKTDAAKNTSIDKIVEVALSERELKFQPEAEASALLRRLSFDLTGLPPKTAEVLAFSRERYEQTVDQLLASPQYGERMAVDWLDSARYADSYGFQVDRDREVWAWRDWVVKAFNENLPYDKFITWQLAGDMLPNPTDEQILATAFNRLHQQESEGGSVEEEYRVEYVADRVQTVATAFLGLTFECSRCHDHKYDPITQKEYYGLFSMLQNIDEAGLYSYFTPSPPTPAMAMMDQPAKEKLAMIQAQIKALEVIQSKPGMRWPNDLKLPATLEHPVAHFTFDALKGNKLANSLHPSSRPQVVEPPAALTSKKASQTAQLTDLAAILKGENKLVSGKIGKAIQFTGDDAVDTPLGNFKRQDPFSLSLWIQTPDVKERAVVLHRSQAWTDAASRGYELLIEDGKLKWSLIHFWPGNAISIRTQTTLPLKQWVHVVVTYDGSSMAQGLKIFMDDQLASVDVMKNALTKTISGGGHDNISLGERMRDRGFKGGLIDDLRIYDRDVSETLDQTLAKDLKTLRSRLYDHQDAQKEIMVMRELPMPKKAYLLTRGEYDKRSDEVGPVTPAFLSPFPQGAPLNRLGYSQWLTAPNHPLTARVTVNRIWQSLFGRGLVKTSEDFGSQGERPLYPELIDYLAAKFIQSGWNVKALVKEMVMSRVYRQQSIADAQVMTDDPENQWLARGPRFRLPAEMIRDNALAAAGLLKLTMGGPPVYPYEMKEAFKPVEPGAGEAVYRRSLYTHWRRTSPPPAMVAFDAPRRAVCASKRERTDSPLQALILLNGIQYVEAARVLGEAIQQEAKGNLEKMIELGFLRCLSRRPDAREMQICTQLYQEQLAHFKTVPQEAEELLQVGAAKRDGLLPLPEAAAATVLAQALLNHDACVVKR